jgi:hypothetical protein
MNRGIPSQAMIRRVRDTHIAAHETAPGEYGRHASRGFKVANLQRLLRLEQLKPRQDGDPANAGKRRS